ncbi:MAG: signal peptidase II [Acidobacteria bacterium]|nr:signal peptidase II [Acidobacteriota bacterium]MCB9397355.1 signal peptidase II [Acidobacteriota bacterium]
MTSSSRRLGLFYGVALTIFGLCQIGSYFVESKLNQHEPHSIFPFLNLTHVRNYGGIFGISQGMGWAFALGASLVLLLVVVFIHKGQVMRPFEYACYGLIVGGGWANVCDRIIYGSVIDYFDVQGIPHWNYIFNAADVSIHLGIWPLILFGLFSRKKSDEPGDPAKPAEGAS